MFKLSRNKSSKQSRPQQCLTLNSFFDDHYYPHAAVAKVQPKNDWSIYNSHLRLNLGHYRLDQLNNALLDVWVREQVVAGYQRSTVNKHIYLMNRLLHLARVWGHLAPVDPNLQTLKRLQLGDYKQRFLSTDEIDGLLKACARSTHPYLYLFVKLLLLTGARKGEALGMCWRDLDFNKRVWTVPRSKNGRSRRIMLNDAAVDVLERTRRKALQLALPTEPTSPVFTNPRTLKPYDSLYAAWYVVCEWANLTGVRFHDLRHTFASLLINKGVSIYEVQTLLGHSNIQMTQRYAHLAPDTLHQRAQIVAHIVTGSEHVIDGSTTAVQ